MGCIFLSTGYLTITGSLGGGREGVIVGGVVGVGVVVSVSEVVLRAVEVVDGGSEQLKRGRQIVRIIITHTIFRRHFIAGMIA